MVVGLSTWLMVVGLSTWLMVVGLSAWLMVGDLQPAAVDPPGPGRWGSTGGALMISVLRARVARLLKFYCTRKLTRTIKLWYNPGVNYSFSV